MQDASPTPTPPPAPRKRSSFTFPLLMVLLLVAAFLGGYIRPTLQARKLKTTLQTTMLDLRLATLHRRLGVASHEAQRNNYASANEAAREFFEGCRALLQSEAFANEPRTRTALTAYASYQEDITTKLTLADPQVKEQLAGMYLAMDGVLARRQ
jgi:hypothetical protein